MNSRWPSPTRPQLTAFGLGCALVAVVAWHSPPGFIPILDHANLLFHEAGHFFVGIFSSRLEIYGGTLGQLLFPALLVTHFFRERHWAGLALSLLWLLENGLNIAHYINDATTQSLPLVGGGMHDWNTILGRWYLLGHERTIASLVRATSLLGMAAVVAWVFAWSWTTDRTSTPDTRS